tara:strand:+ start:1422 stop:1763 length:342 start_codon:yes stop_codon:yes gene_type:complete
MAELKLDVNILGLGKVNLLVNLLVKHKDLLPKELLNSVLELVDCDEFEYDRGYFSSRGFGPITVHADGYEVSNVLSINPILKTIKVMDRATDIEFSFCNILSKGESIMQIGGA